MDDSRVVPLTLLGQTVVTLCVAAGAWLWQGQVAGVSALLGGATAVIPNGFLAARLLQWRAGSSAASLLRSVWIGEIGKLLLTVALFAAIFGRCGRWRRSRGSAASSPRRWWFSAPCCSVARGAQKR